MGFYGYPEYVSVAEKKEKARKYALKLQKKGKVLVPIHIEGKMIARTFWGRTWCENLSKYSDLENRLPRGRSYVRHGSVIDLKIFKGEIRALVYGSTLYNVTITIDPLKDSSWKNLVKEASGKTGSLIELLQGKVSKEVMRIMIQEEYGLFPDTKEIHFNCECYDYAEMCKHVAAVLYGVGARLDYTPEVLFLLRSVSPEDLLPKSEGLLSEDQGASKLEGNLEEIFGIKIDQ